MSQTVVLRLTTSDFDFCVDYVPLGGSERFYLAHIDVFNWSPTTFRKMKAIWPVLRAKINSPLFCWSEVDDEKFAKWCQRFGFRYFKQFIGPDGLEHRLYLHI